MANFGPGIYADQGGVNAAYNLTSATVIKATPGRLVRVLVVASNTAGAGQFNDCATTAAAASSNEILSIPQNTVVGTAYLIEWPCGTGIVLSAAGSGTFSVSYS